MAEKLKECGAFGVSSDEYLNYALENRREWLNKGEAVVEGYLAKYKVEKGERLEQRGKWRKYGDFFNNPKEEK